VAPRGGAQGAGYIFLPFSRAALLRPRARIPYSATPGLWIPGSRPFGRALE